MGKKLDKMTQRVLKTVNKDRYAEAFDRNIHPNCMILKVVDSETQRRMITREGKEVWKSEYEGFKFGCIIGSVNLHRNFNEKQPIYEFYPKGSKEYGKMPKTVGSYSGYEYVRKALHGRPIGITIEELKKLVVPLLRMRAKSIIFYTRSMALGLDAWYSNSPEHKAQFEKFFGKDKWLASVSSPLPEGKNQEMEHVNQVLKKLKAEYRIKTPSMQVTKLMRQDLW